MILSESVFHTMLNSEMYKNPYKVCIFSLILLPTPGEKILHDRMKKSY